MPRTARAVEAGLIYHVINRGNGRRRMFRKDMDFAAFEKIMAEGLKRYPVDILTYCLMDNHWHLVLRPRTDAALGRFMGWIGVTHVRRHHAHYQTTGGGHLYQGRFKSFPVEQDSYFLALCRYVEANPLRAKLVDRAESWPWSGLFHRKHGGKPFELADWPIDRPANWLTLVNREIEDSELEQVRLSVRRGRPFGDEVWVDQTARRLGLLHTLRAPWRPKKLNN